MGQKCTQKCLEINTSQVLGNCGSFKTLVVLGEKYREENLQRSCADFILANVEEPGDDLLSEFVRPSQQNFSCLVRLTKG